MVVSQGRRTAAAADVAALDARVDALETGGVADTLGRAEGTGDGSNRTFPLGVSAASVYKIEVNDADQPLSVGSVVGSDFVFGSGNAPPSGHHVLLLFTY